MRLRAIPGSDPRSWQDLSPNLDQGLTRQQLAAVAPELAVELLTRAELLLRDGCLEEVLIGPDGPVLARQLLSPYFQPIAYRPEATYRLSRFACCRREGEQLVIESPRAAARIVVLEPCALPGLLAPDSGCQLLAECGLHVTGPEEDEAPHLAVWEFHDLFFHSRSRRGRHRQPMGATRRFAGQLDPPQRRPRQPQRRLALGPPTGRLAQALDEVLANRRSQRRPSQPPLDLGRLGDFLHYCARAQEPGLKLRPFASAGAIYEQELYLTVACCQGLEPGFYRYDPLGHALELFPSLSQARLDMLFQASWALGIERPPALVITIAARFPALAWKYSAIAYSLALKNAGAVIQTMYLVATALNLSACAMGYGDSDLFCRLAGTVYEEESSIAEFALI
ncbi:MAG: SagB family peptide dehydrogenase [Candidatus Eremiobacteraeota bacterium]|nr:SagB family peptide dehydrogenase [Candidatus Eremiobacteraeota bacterium]